MLARNWAWGLGLICLASLGFPAAISIAEEAPGSASADDRLRRALEILEHVPAGRDLIGRAQKFWGLARRGDLREVLVWGRASKTDAVLTRHFDPKTGAETRDRQVTVYLKSNQPLEDLVLDLAHELVHATSRPTWDPYDPHLTAGRYVWAAIEGEGGEVDAVMAECRVSFELLDRYGTAVVASRRCRGYLGDAGALSGDLVRRDFYRVGRWHPELARELRPELKLFPLLSPETPKLYSSTGNAPYPASLVKEFHDITQIACANSRRRVVQSSQSSQSPQSSAAASSPGAGPAGEPAKRAPAAENQDSVSSFLAKRCADVSP